MTRDDKGNSSDSSHEHSLYLHNGRIMEGERKESENGRSLTYRYFYNVIYVSILAQAQYCLKKIAVSTCGWPS